MKCEGKTPRLEAGLIVTKESRFGRKSTLLLQYSLPARHPAQREDDCWSPSYHWQQQKKRRLKKYLFTFRKHSRCCTQILCLSLIGYNLLARPYLAIKWSWGYSIVAKGNVFNKSLEFLFVEKKKRWTLEGISHSSTSYFFCLFYCCCFFTPSYKMVTMLFTYLLSQIVSLSKKK